MHGWSSTRRALLSSSRSTFLKTAGSWEREQDVLLSRPRSRSACKGLRASRAFLPHMKKELGMVTHRVRFQPVGIEIEVNEDETVLNAAFRQGISLTHGCREGQCSACKSFLLDGDMEMEKYSTFALPEYESDEGYVLLCRCHAYSDLEVELINYDEDILRLGIR